MPNPPAYIKFFSLPVCNLLRYIPSYLKYDQHQQAAGNWLRLFNFIDVALAVPPRDFCLNMDEDPASTGQTSEPSAPLTWPMPSPPPPPEPAVRPLFKQENLSYCEPPSNKIEPPSLQFEDGDTLIALSTHPCDRLLLHSEFLKKSSGWFALQLGSFNAPRQDEVDKGPTAIRRWAFGMKLHDNKYEVGEESSLFSQVYTLQCGVC